MNNEDQYKKISERISLRDDLLGFERELAGKANSYGLQMHLPEKFDAAAVKIDFVKSCMSPKSLLKHKLNQLLEGLRTRKTTSDRGKQILLSVEAMTFWGDLAYELATSVGAPYAKLAGASADLILKATHILSRDKSAALQKTMDQFWSEAQQFRRMHTHAVNEIDREIALLK